LPGAGSGPCQRWCVWGAFRSVSNSSRGPCDSGGRGKWNQGREKPNELRLRFPRRWRLSENRRVCPWMLKTGVKRKQECRGLCRGLARGLFSLVMTGGVTGGGRGGFPFSGCGGSWWLGRDHRGGDSLRRRGENQFRFAVERPPCCFLSPLLKPCARSSIIAPCARLCRTVGALEG
jgi:hypothetical protein